MKILERFFTISQHRFPNYTDFEEVYESLFQRIKMLYKLKAPLAFRICQFIQHHPLHYSGLSDDDWDYKKSDYVFIKTAKTKMDRDFQAMSNCRHYKLIDDIIMNYPRNKFKLKEIANSFMFYNCLFLRRQNI